MYLIEHRKSTASEGKQLLFWIAVTCGGLAALQYFFLGQYWSSSPMFFLLFWFVLGAIAIVALVVAAQNLVAGKTFVCRLSRDWLECDCPVRSCGESFKVAVSELRRLEKHASDEMSFTWYLWDAAGRRYWLTANYENPLDEIVAQLKQLNPQATVFVT